MRDNGVGMGQDLACDAKLQAYQAERRRDYQVTQVLEVVALPGGFIVHARDDHGEKNRREVVSTPDALVAIVQRWAREAGEKAR